MFVEEKCDEVSSDLEKKVIQNMHPDILKGIPENAI